MIWAGVAVAAVGCYLLKLLGLSIPQQVLDRREVRSVAALMPVALLAALVSTGTFATATRLTIDARVAGLAVAVVALLLRAPFLVVVVAAAAGAAVVRSLEPQRPHPAHPYNNAVPAMIVYMTTLPVADARAQLSRLIDAATATHERFEITRNGRRAAVLLSADDYDTLQDTLAVLADAELLTGHHAGQAAIQAGDYSDADQLAHAMRAAGRLRQ